MTTTHRILRDTTAWAAVLSVVSALVGGVDLGLQVALVAAGTVGNLMLYAALTERYLASVAAGHGGGPWGRFLSSKVMFTAAVVALALTVLDPIAVAIGMSALFFGVATTGLSLALTPPEPMHAAGVDVAVESR